MDILTELKEIMDPLRDAIYVGQYMYEDGNAFKLIYSEKSDNIVNHLGHKNKVSIFKIKVYYRSMIFADMYERFESLSNLLLGTKFVQVGGMETVYLAPYREYSECSMEFKVITNTLYPK